METATTDETTASDNVTNYKYTTSAPALDPADQTEDALFTLLKVQNKLKVKYAGYTASRETACAAVSPGASCNAGDFVSELSGDQWATAAYETTDAYKNAKKHHDGAVAALAILKAKLLIATKDKATANTANVNKL